MIAQRDYSLTGAESARAKEAGLANAEWFRPVIAPERLQELMARTNGRAACDVALWAGLLIISGVLAFVTLGSWWCVPCFVVYGALYGGAADPRWHEHGHGTALHNRRANDAVYYVASFMLLREPTLWRWSHVRHHSDTIVVGRDPEIVFPRPFRLRRLIPNYLNTVNGPAMLRRMAMHALGRLDADARDFVPETEHRRVVGEARVFVAVYLVPVAWSLATRSIVPLLFVGLPSFYGVWLLWFFAVTQHVGLREDVLDHRLNTRTVCMNPVFRFLYLNMNYHVEHHIFPAVPYYNLPALHTAIKDQLAPPTPSTWAAYREIVDALRHQRRDPRWEIAGRPVPDLVGAVEPSSDGPTPVVGAEVDLGDAADLTVGAMRRIDLDGRTYLLCRPEQTRFALTAGLCTHGRTHLIDGLLDGCVVECPKHNGRFDVFTGLAVRRPAQAPLDVHKVAIVGGRLVARIGAADPPAADPPGADPPAADSAAEAYPRGQAGRDGDGDPARDSIGRWPERPQQTT